MKTEISNIIYIWVTNNTPFNPSHDYCPIFNSDNYPFLQNAIAHSSDSRRVHIVQCNLHQNTGIDDAFVNLQSDCVARGLNIKIHNLFNLAKDDVQFCQLIKRRALQFSHIIDLAKIYIGANLHQLGLDEAVISDFDCVIPEHLEVSFEHFDVLPLIEKDLDCIRIDYMGAIDHYLENGFSAVKGGKNTTYQNMLKRAKEKDSSYYNSFKEDAVYRIFITEILRAIAPEENKALDSETLFKKYARHSMLENTIKTELFQLQDLIIYDRGGSWLPHKKSPNKRPILKSGSYPIFQREIRELNRMVCFPSEGAKLILKVNFLLKKGFDINRPIDWNNSLQKESSLLANFLARFDNDKASYFLDNFKKLINLGADVNDDVLFVLLRADNQFLCEALDHLIEKKLFKPVDLRTRMIIHSARRHSDWFSPEKEKSKIECINKWYSHHAPKGGFMERFGRFFTPEKLKQSVNSPTKQAEYVVEHNRGYMN
ncbi:hypothetical protein clem_08160 [Legionella clemsonensis]|uniref:Uncharacterized protein n=1 Tax=Legionella clemsonensis TaxID=1867846 RepID=A0A222P2U2_9GAMM|nr:hypothetical protein clem_08160 [Legionella clemsonensis]